MRQVYLFYGIEQPPAMGTASPSLTVLSTLCQYQHQHHQPHVQVEVQKSKVVTCIIVTSSVFFVIYLT